MNQRNHVGRQTDDDALRAVVSEALRRADPVGLLAIGAPANEYDPEVRTIVPRLMEATTALHIQEILHEEFCRWFGESTAGSKETYQRPAERIWGFIASHEV